MAELHTVIEWIWKIFAPLLLSIGTVGNVLCICILQRKRMAVLSASLYFTVLAVVDTIALYMGLTRHLIIYNGNTDPRLESDLACAFHLFFLYSAICLSSWILSALTVERCIYVRLPYTAKFICNKRKAAIVVTVLTLLICAIYSHFLWTVKIMNVPNNRTCNIIDESFRKWIFPWLDLSLSTLIPLVIISTSNGMIISTLVRSRFHNKYSNKAKSGNHAITSMTAMLISVSIGYCLTKMPIAIFLIFDHSVEEGDVKDLVFSVLSVLEYFHHSINFLLYIVSGPRFRHETRAMFSVVCHFCRSNQIYSVSHALQTEETDQLPPQPSNVQPPEQQP
ncbi:uncharacterized protein LOC106154370 [Lingula anatina]|uniref:Uncharacterized protein LOC106154370 n=1 Tax=Lingula anatina TaxID=7574 RepID=A0A1S3HF83_LINAN|nr:uncharacterized protein LOC106154370 [Lingula anatina]|eukprot:XP_013384156.1 uncharacterized protein LOC106154370 [Lingula anatina]